jgi:SAM-dependent methyltransferase
VEEYAAAVREWIAARGTPRGLILGVTPELYRLPWPTDALPRAVDHTRAMIDALWPGDPASALHAKWTDVPLPDSSIDIALCDGGFHLLAHPSEQRALVRSLARLISPGGIFVLRLFVPPVERESVEQVMRALEEGSIPNLNVLKLRLGMALQASSEQGVVLHGVWQALHDRHPDPALLAQQLGWELAHLRAIDTYKNCASRYHFVSVDLAHELFCANGAGFEVVSMHCNDYPLGERCPIVVYRRKSR